MTATGYAKVYLALGAMITAVAAVDLMKNGYRLAWAMVGIGIAQMIVAVIKWRRETKRKQQVRK